MSTNTSLFSKILSNVGSPLVGHHQPTILGKANTLTPTKSELEAKLNCEVPTNSATPSMDFSALTAADFGITPESFTKRHKGESKSLLKKFRRRSTIGVRGSPENNSLIRHIACQKRTKMQDTLMQASPFKERNSLLKNKIAAFQSSFKPLEETQEKVNPYNEADTSLQEQSKLGQVFEEGLNDKSINGVRTSADIQVHNFVPPSQKLLTGSIAVSKAVPALLASTSGYLPLETTPSRDISKDEHGIQSSHTNEELSINTTAQYSCKKVRFSEKQRLEIFDQAKPPITPVQKNHLPSSSLRSVLKKTPVKMLTEGSSEKSSNVIPLKQSLSQPNFDHDDDLLQGSSEVLSTTEYSMNSDLKETKDNSSDLQTVRITRSSTKTKYVNKGEEKALSLANKMQAKNSKREHSKLQKAKPATKPSSKKTPTARRKVFGKRRRRKKEQKALYGQRETVSKKPLLSPIPEMTEDLSFMSSYRSTPKSQMSIFDDSSSSVTAESNGVVHSNEEDGSCLHSSLDLLKEEDLSSSSSQLQDAAVSDMKNLLLWDPAEKTSPEEMKSTLNENEQALKSDCPSGETEMQKEPELLNLQGTDENKETKGDSFFIVNSAIELMNESNSMNFKRFPRRSRRLACYLPNVEDDQSEAPGNNSSVLGGNVEELPPMPQTGNDSELLNHLQCSIEESFRAVPRRVRRSMRRLKDAENEGLAWVQIPANNSISQAPLGSACKAQRRMSSSSPQESELLHQKRVNGAQMVLPTKEEQENMIGPYESRKRRKSMCVLSFEENKNMVLHVQKNRRASLGYKSDYCYRKDSEMTKFLANHLVV
ncbi:cell division cycle-associated protein 2 [Elgaria multicarinata webbii]|uniref:cell division cycle-associated protein 2 n=1 Tax=Elgaria multicarinata webbii TaxID=159646 RepID=UPI002FCD05C1